jgi:hypothetical protein
MNDNARALLGGNLGGQKTEGEGDGGGSFHGGKGGFDEGILRLPLSANAVNQDGL